MPPAFLTNCVVASRPVKSKPLLKEIDLAELESIASLVRRTLNPERREKLMEVKGSVLSPEAIAILTSDTPFALEKTPVVVPILFLLDLLRDGGIDVNTLQVALSAKVEARSPSFGSVLKRIREAQQITQTDLAEKSKVAVSSIIQYESGRRSPSLAVAAKLAKALGVGLERFADCDFGDD